MYSKGAKGDSQKNTKRVPSQPLTFQPRTLSTNSVATPTPVLPPTPSYDPFPFASTSNGRSSGPPTSSLDPSFACSPTDDSAVLDPQLLALQHSPQHMIPTPFATEGTGLPTIDQSPDYLPGPSPFTWNDFTFFDELNHSLGILNPTDDLQSQIDQLMTSVLPSGSATAWPSTPNVSNLPDPAITDSSSSLFRIPKATEVPIKGVHSAPPPTRNIDKKLDEATWKARIDDLKIPHAVVCSKTC
jgi:hypothetical protein